MEKWKLNVKGNWIQSIKCSFYIYSQMHRKALIMRSKSVAKICGLKAEEVDVLPDSQRRGDMRFS